MNSKRPYRIRFRSPREINPFVYLYDVHFFLMRPHVSMYKSVNTEGNLKGQQVIQKACLNWIQGIADDSSLTKKWIEAAHEKNLRYTEKDIDHLVVCLQRSHAENRLITFQEFKPIYDKEILYTLSQ